MRARALVVVLAMGIFAGVAMGGLATSVAADDADLVLECAEQPDEEFADPAAGNETVGWFDGYWYDEPLEFDVEGELTEEQFAQLSARTAARIEAMRCLSFETFPSIEIIDQDTFADEQSERFDEWAEPARQFDNQQFKTLLTIGSARDSVEVREEAQSTSVAGYYDFVTEEIVIVGDEDSLAIDEPILAHELGHALQDQHFGLQGYNRSTKDLDKGTLGLIEGDVGRLEHRYRERCEDDRWSEDCLSDTDDGDTDEPPSWGYYFMNYQPYSDGPAFVDHVYEEGGWDSVNALYDDVPNSTMQTINPHLYGAVEPEDLEVNDRSTDQWHRLDLNGSPDYNVIGQGGMSAMFMGQSIESVPDVNAMILSEDEFTTGDPIDPLNYDVEATDGWRGDRLHAYRDDDNRTAGVWETAWSREDEMNDFLDAYEALASYRGGERVDDLAHTWTFNETEQYDMALTLYPEDDRLWIVTAPTVDDLVDVHQDIELIEGNESEGTPNGGDAAPPGTDDGSTDDRINGDDGIPLPGFGPLAALAAFAVIAVRLGWGSSRR